MTLSVSDPAPETTLYMMTISLTGTGWTVTPTQVPKAVTRIWRVSPPADIIC
jgi:hypothetical protein